MGTAKDEYTPRQIIEIKPGPGNVEFVPPRPDTVELTKKILDQNEMILKMNADLLRMLTHPVWMVKND